MSNATFYDCSSQFLKSVTTATSIFDVQATGGDNDEEEDEAKWDNDFEKNSLRRLVKSFWDSSILCQTVRYFVTLKLGNFDYGTSIFRLAFLQKYWFE